MSDEPIPLARPVIGEREEELVLEVLRSGRLSLGPRLGEFEDAFARWVGGGARASAVSSGTAGLHLAVRAAGIEPGDEVITTPLSFVASANCVVYEGARPVFCDIDPVTLNLDPSLSAGRISDKTSGILPVHIYGVPADMDAFEELARKHSLWIVEDACEALGARYPDGRPVGARGNLAVFAFYANKQLATGEGGMVLSPTGDLKARIDSERNQGRAPDMGWLDHDRLGFNYRLPEVSCALGIAQLERLDALLEGRARAAALYDETLAEIEELELPPASADRSWFVYVVRLPRRVDRDAAIRALRAEGIDSKPYLPAIHLMSFYRERYGHREGEFPVCEDVAARSLALPFFPGLAESQVARVAAALRRILGA